MKFSVIIFSTQNYLKVILTKIDYKPKEGYELFTKKN